MFRLNCMILLSVCLVSISHPSKYLTYCYFLVLNVNSTRLKGSKLVKEKSIWWRIDI